MVIKIISLAMAKLFTRSGQVRHTWTVNKYYIGENCLSVNWRSSLTSTALKSADSVQGGSRLATAKSELLSNASAVSAQPPSVPRGRRASYAMGEQQSRIWTQGFTGNSSMLQQRVQPPGVNASYGASRYSRVGVAGGSGGMTARPPMRRSKSSMLQLNNSAGNRYGNAVPSQNFQLDTATQVRQGYPNVRQNPRQISNASLFSRGAGAPTQRFIPATESSVSEEAGDDDVFMTRSFVSDCGLAWWRYYDSIVWSLTVSHITVSGSPHRVKFSVNAHAG